MANAAPSSLAPEVVEAHIREHGGRSAIARFFKCDASGDPAYARIRTGNKRWLAIAVRLLDDSDACVTTSLLSSIGAALPKSPANVLPLVEAKPLLQPSEVCLPFMSNEEDPRKHLKYLQTVEKALLAFKDQSLRTQRDICLREVRVATAGVRIESARCPVTDEEFFEQLTTMKDWKTIYSVFKRNQPRCPDDGSFGQGYSGVVVDALADRWDELAQLEGLIGKAPEFGRFVYRHIDATAGEDELRRVVDNAEGKCPRRSKALCRDIAKRARAALASY